MKNIKYFVLAILSLTLLNCSSEDDNGTVAYGGAPYLNFLNQGAEEQLSVISNTNSVITTVNVGTLAPVSGSHTVKIVPVLEGATAIRDVDYRILNETVILENGQTSGSFEIEFLKEHAVESGKRASFVLESDLPKAVFNTVHVINVKLSCPISVLEGEFSANSRLYGAKNYTIVRAENDASQITIRDFWQDNIGYANPQGTTQDFIISYNDSNYVIGDLPFQYTNTIVNGREVVVALDNTQVSRINPCTRTVTLHLIYRTRNAAGTAIELIPKTEVFTGISVD